MKKRKPHIWCNECNPFVPLDEHDPECEMCKSLWENYPLKGEDTPEDLMKRHFPNNIIVRQ